MRLSVVHTNSTIITHTAQAHGCTAEVTWHDGYPVTHNDPALTAAMAQQDAAAAMRIIARHLYGA